MSESKHQHTRGPWRTHIADRTLIVDADGNKIARTLGDYDAEYEAMETRATFLASAPDLYAALAALVAEFPTSMDAAGPFGGLTLREYLAGQAMAGLLASGLHDCEAPGIAHDALLFADALLAALKAEG